jgi:hypothetical protein
MSHSWSIHLRLVANFTYIDPHTLDKEQRKTSDSWNPARTTSHTHRVSLHGVTMTDF